MNILNWLVVKMVFKTNWCLKWFHHWLTYCLIYLMVFKFKPMNIQQNIPCKFEKRMGVPAFFFPKQVRKWMEKWTGDGSWTNQKCSENSSCCCNAKLSGFNPKILGKRQEFAKKPKDAKMVIFQDLSNQTLGDWPIVLEIGNKRLLESSENPRSKMNWELSIHVCNRKEWRSNEKQWSNMTRPETGDEKVGMQRLSTHGCNQQKGRYEHWNLEFIATVLVGCIYGSQWWDTISACWVLYRISKQKDKPINHVHLPPAGFAL